MFIVLIVAGLLLGTTGCSGKDPLSDDTGSTDDEVDVVDMEGLEKYLKANYSRYVIDGSTSLIPLHEALDAKFGKGRKIEHSKTVAAFEDFVDGKIDILLAVDYLDSYFAKAQEKNVEINKKEITKEAMVFLKNKNFKIKSLTVKQIKNIFNRKITKWGKIDKKYTGSKALDILPIYRNEDSGSGMAMLKLLGKKSIDCDKNNCLYVYDMSDVVNAIAGEALDPGYDEMAIAYNIYTFTEKQYHNEDVVNFQINGVEPNDDTIFSGEYPITLFNYIYYKNDKAKEFGEKLYEYLVSDEGQKLIMQYGYVPLTKQDNVIVKDTSRNCTTNFVDEFCVLNEGYNEELDQYVKISFSKKAEKYEYFNTVEEYIFANSNITEKEFDKLSDFLDTMITQAQKEETTAERIVFKKKKNGNIKFEPGNCGGAYCLFFEAKPGYNFGKNMFDENGYSGFVGDLTISKDFKTISGGEKDEDYDYTFTIPFTDFFKAFTFGEQ